MQYLSRSILYSENIKNLYIFSLQVILELTVGVVGLILIYILYRSVVKTKKLFDKKRFTRKRRPYVPEEEEERYGHL